MNKQSVWVVVVTTASSSWSDAPAVENTHVAGVYTSKARADQVAAEKASAPHVVDVDVVSYEVDA